MKKLDAQKAGKLFWIGEILLCVISMFIFAKFGFLWQFAFYSMTTIVWAIFVERKLTKNPSSIQSLFGGDK